MAEQIGGTPPREQPRPESPLRQYIKTVGFLHNFVERRGVEGARNVSRVFFDALSLLPNAIEDRGKTHTHPYHTAVWGHTEARNLYMTGLRAAEMQGSDVKENEIVRQVASLGLVTETQALIDLKAKVKEVFPE